ncbi:MULTISPECIES: substrate-binding domain-containing protein [Aurantimonas]|uniref:substrate-binding domain-containing protein n=1 Tax=Aurantimonas TaxID=182269 RepID=UPI000401ED34|nr:substrate-binding domain-containing protein [Aurantimonas coralicida]
MQYVTKAGIRSLSVVLGLVAFGPAASADSLRIGGTGVALGGMSLLAEAFEAAHPDTEIDVLPSLGSSGGVKALLAGAIDLSVSSRALKDAETEQGAIARLYATTPLAVVTSTGTDAEAVTTPDLAKIYAGTLREWPSGEAIRVVLRPESESDTQILRGLSDDMAAAVDDALKRPGLVSATNDQENAETLERLPGSVGVIALGQIATEGRKLKVLELDGIRPTPGATDPRSQRLIKSLYIVSTAQTAPAAEAFVDFVFSPEGRAILAANDHTPAE